MKKMFIKKMVSNIIENIKAGKLSEEQCYKMFKKFKPSWVKEEDLPDYIHQRYTAVKEGKLTADHILEIMNIKDE